MSRLKVLSQKPVFTAKHFLVNEVQVEVEGLEKTFHHVVIKPAAYVIPLTKENEVYLIRNYRYIFDQECTEIPAGYIEDGEEPLTAAKRELQEEAGLIANSWKDLGVIDTSSSTTKAPMYYFLARDLEEGKQKLDDAEDIRVIKMPIQEAVQKIHSGEINNQKTITGILLVYSLLNLQKT